jgi:hypothetical protein
MRTAEDPATKLTSQDSASQHNAGPLKGKRKQLPSAQAIKGNHQAGEGNSKLLFLLAMSEQKLRPRKITKARFRGYVDRENVWMVHTIRHINKAIKICDEQDEDLDNEQHRLDKQTKKGKKQEKIAKKQKRLNFPQRF